MLESQIQTPALVLDMDVFEKNLKGLKNTCDTLGLAMRPHYKSAKATALAHREIEAGAVGMCCAKVSEAEDLVESGIEDVLIANQITDRAKIAKVASLAACCRLGVCVDRADNIADLEQAAAFQGSTIYCYVEYDVGMNRCGVYTPEEFYALVQQIETCPHLKFGGIQAYAGNIAHCEDYEERKASSMAVEERIRTLKDYLEAHGVKVDVVTGVSTGTIGLRGSDTVYTEVQCGSFIFMDAAYRAVGAEFDHALSVLATVMDSYSDHATTDVGIKAISTDQRPPFFLEYPDTNIRFSEEHCKLFTLDCKPGQKLHMVPSHCCTTINLYDWLYLVRGGKVVDKVPVTGRGKSI